MPTLPVHRRVLACCGALALFALMSACATVPGTGGADAAEGRGEIHPMPNQWFMAQRMSLDPLPPAVRRRALEALAAADGAVGGGGGGGVDQAPGTWVSEGPLNIGGRITALAVDPNDEDRVWAGAADGGVWLSADAGVTWTPVFDDQTTLSIGAIAAHPTDSNTVYVGTGEDNGGGYSYDGDGVYKTTDGGTTWTNVGLTATRRIGRIAVDPVDPQRVFVAAGGDVFNADASRGIYRSVDGGASWQQVLFVADDSGGIDVAIDPDDPTVVYAAIWQRLSQGSSWYIAGTNSGVYKSTDGGDTWSQLTNGLPSGPNVGRIGLAVAPSDTSKIYAIVIDGSGDLLGVYRTTNGGNKWSKRSDNTLPILFSGFSYYFGTLAIDPNDSDKVYLMDQRLWLSTNGGSSFSSIANSVHVDHHALYIGPAGRIYDGNDGGFYTSNDDGSSWVHSVTMPITQFYDIGIDTLDPNRRFGGTQDNGTNRTTTGGQSDWQNVLGGDGMETEVDYTDSNKVYAESQFGNINRSTDGGDTFVNARAGIDLGERANWVTPISIDPVVPTRLYTGRQKVYRSDDAAVSWTAISDDLTDTGPGGTDGGGAGGALGQNHLENLIRSTITVVKASPVDGQVVWAGTDDGNVWVTSDGGSSWTNVNPPGIKQWVTDIAPDPFDASQAYLTVTGFRVGDRTPYVFVTSDLGQTWADVSAGLPQVPTNTVVADPDWPGQVFVGNDVGVYLTDDGGASWQAMSGGVPIVVVLDFHLHDPTRTLYAGTHGRGIYTYDLGQLPPPDRDGDGAVNVNDCAPDDGGAFAVPVEVSPLDVERGPAGEAELSWPSLASQAGTGTVYDVAKDALSSLRGAGGLSAMSGLSCGQAATAVSDAAAVTPGDGVAYLVRARNACATGSWGLDGAAAERTVPACP